MKKLFFLRQFFQNICKLRSLFLVCGLLLFIDVFGQTDTLSFLHISDTHLMFHLDSYHPGTALLRAHFAKGVEPFRNFLQTVPAATNSKMVVITGDMLDLYETDTPNGDMLAFQLQQYARIPEVSQIPVFCTLGNHDITTYGWKDERWYWNMDNAGKARAEWIRNVPCFTNGTWYSHVYNVGQTGYRLIILDNSYAEGSERPYCGEEQLQWLKVQLQQSPEEAKIVFMHIPFSRDFNPHLTRNALYDLLAQYPCVKLLLVGHNHENVINRYDGAGFVQVQTGAFGYDVTNWRLIKLTADNIIVSTAGTKQQELIIPIK